ncbi:hypothetical protein C8R45DRAFT_943024 [Mycena sanguinolenta]|nr:hypothetical protein C8R45DRAFT_943024 [Mycena sanguinolenta]
MPALTWSITAALHNMFLSLAHASKRSCTHPSRTYLEWETGPRPSPCAPLPLPANLCSKQRCGHETALATRRCGQCVRLLPPSRAIENVPCNRLAALGMFSGEPQASVSEVLWWVGFASGVIDGSFDAISNDALLGCTKTPKYCLPVGIGRKSCQRHRGNMKDERNPSRSASSKTRKATRDKQASWKREESKIQRRDMATWHDGKASTREIIIPHAHSLLA